MLSPCDSWQTPICSERKRELPPIFAGDHLIDRRTAGTASGESSSGHQAAHRAMMIVSRSRLARSGIVEPADDLKIVAEPRERTSDTGVSW